MAKISNITVKDIFNDICALNAGNYARYERNAGQQMADDCRGSIFAFLPEESLAKKIMRSTTRYSVKQLWVIAYELAKNEEYINHIIAYNRAYNLEVYGDEEEE